MKQIKPPIHSDVLTHFPPHSLIPGSVGTGIIVNTGVTVTTEVGLTGIGVAVGAIVGTLVGDTVALGRNAALGLAVYAGVVVLTA
jgi:hypothetical protein